MAATGQMHNLTTLIKRLEAATSRLEDIASTTELPADGSAAPQSTPAAPSSTAASASQAPRAPPPPPVSAPAKPAAEELPEPIQEFNEFIASCVKPYVELSEKLDPAVGEQAQHVLDVFKRLSHFLHTSVKSKKPADAELFKLFAPVSEGMAATQNVKGDRSVNSHLQTVSDGMIALGWVVDPKPRKAVSSGLESAQFFGNKVRMEHKDKNPEHVEWLQAFYGIFKGQEEYLLNHFTSGLTWNPNGGDAAQTFESLKSVHFPEKSAPATGGAPPPPPPPPPPPGAAPVLDIKPVSGESSAPAPAAGGFGAVFSELNKGEAVTHGLRKVDKSEMTHKNPSLRESSTVSSRGKSPAPSKKPKPESMRIKKPAKKELEGNKWTIENYDKEPEPIEIEASLSHSILISRCNNTTIIVKGKANQVTVENSTRLSLIVDTLVSTVDVVKAQNFGLQVIGTIPTVMLDQVDNASIYFSQESIGTKVFTSKSDGVNLNIIDGSDEDYREVPLPSQICSYYDAEKHDLVNEIVAHAG